MNKHLLSAAALISTMAVTGCAGFESSSTPVAPSGDTSVASLLGDWTSSSGAFDTAANGCSSFQWHVTTQTGNSLSGDFSAVCANGITVSGAASGQMDGSDVTYQVNGSASVPGIASCPFSLNGVAHIEGDSIRVPYSGTTCLGPVQGEETLHRPTEPQPTPAPAPEPTPGPPPAPSNPYHVADGPLSVDRAQQVVFATGREFPGLTVARATEAEGRAAAEELLLRMIWHLHLAGYDAGRQRNPSGAISGDKLTIFINGSWHAYDVFRSVGAPGVPAEIIFLEVFPAGPVPDGGIPD